MFYCMYRMQLVKQRDPRNLKGRAGLMTWAESFDLTI